ncbi:Vacuolar morphogenesis protein 6 [Ceratobasidium sp. 428]|nr:Vacuolar morphogenesis protein 6 [Ceratobasidium sp. 428]
MPPFYVLPVAKGIKDRVEALVTSGDKVYLGTNTGTLYVYDVARVEGDDEPNLTLKETRRSLVKRQIDQLGVLKDINSLVVLSDSVITLFPLSTLSPPTILAPTRNASVFTIDTSVQYELADGSLATPTQSESRGIATVVTVLAVGCKRKVVVFRWHDGEAQPVKELPLDHTPRAISFPTPHTITMAYPPPDHAVLSLTNMALTEFVLPATNTVTQNAGMSMGMGMGMGALSGLGGYMGLGAKAKQAVVKIEDGEVLIPKESTGLFFGVDGQTTRPLGVDWPAAPEETVYTKPYIISSFPPHSLPASSGTDHSASSGSLATLTQQTSTIPNSALQIRSSLSLQPVQTLRFPFVEDPAKAAASAPATKPGAASKQQAPPPPHALRLLTTTPGSGPGAPAYVLSTPTDRTALASEGSTLWALVLRPWAIQVEELVHLGKYADALALLGVVPVQPDPTKRVQGLRAVQLFKEGAFEKAMEMFLELDMNPAKVIALYPETLSGRLATPRERWIGLFGGDPPAKVEEPIAEVDEKSVAVVEGMSEEEAQKLAAAVGVMSSSPPPSEMPQSPPASISGGLTGKLRAGLGAVGVGSSDADSIREHPAPKGKKSADEFTLSTRALDMFLVDRRPKIPAALQPFGITAAQSTNFPALSATSIDELMALPSAPLGTLTPDQLVRAAQLVDTALFRLYLISRPAFIGPLCRVDNWCEVTEVEEALKGRKKFTELIDLYKGKKMHAKALDLLHQLAQSEDDPLDKYDPSIRYLQKLGPEYLDLIFKSARWIFEAKPDLAFNIFTAEEVELPRGAVADYLEGIDPMLAIKFIEYLFSECQEESHTFGDRLGELYLRSAVQFRRAKDKGDYEHLYSKLLAFVNTSKYYHPDRLYALLPSEDLYEARAILLGKLGNHQGALEIYVKKMQDYTEAEEYCKRVYQTEPDPHGVFLTLLKIFLQPTSSTTPSLLRPALDLISRQSPRIDPIETLKLLPPLVQAADLRSFLTESLRAPKVDARIERELWLARSQQADRRVAALHTRRVRVTDSRICPQCNKRLGNSVVAVHMPRGEVTHYQCREAFSKRLNDPQKRGL